MTDAGAEIYVLLFLPVALLDFLFVSRGNVCIPPGVNSTMNISYILLNLILLALV